MINDILEEIRAVEIEADETMAKAVEDAKQAVVTADEESRNIRSNTIKAVKEERRKVVDLAIKEGEVRYAKILSAGKTEADKILKETDIKPAIAFIKEKVLSCSVDS